MIEYVHRPATVREALALQRKHARECAFLAGGTYLNSRDYPAAPRHLIRLDALGLDRIAPATGGLLLGACCTLQHLADDRRTPAPLKAALALVSNRSIRNAATLGGHVAARLPESDVLPTLVALEAAVLLAGARGKGGAPLAEWLAKPAPGLVTGVLLPRLAAGRRTACLNLRTSGIARSTLSVAVAVTVRRGVLEDPAIAVGGALRHVVRVTAVERALAGKPLPEPDAVAALVSAAVKPAAGLEGSVAFRRYQAGALVARALASACAGQGGAR